MDFEEVIKHLSDTYGVQHYFDRLKGECPICTECDRVLGKYRFLSLRKEWDHDD